MAPAELGIVAPEKMIITVHDLALAAALGLLAAVLGILLMRGVALCENVFSRMRLRPALRTHGRRLFVGLMAMVTPQIMSSGHGALRVAGMLDLSLRTVAIVFALKILASIVSLGSGFRGGLFFSSLLMGALGGHLLVVSLTEIWPTVYFDPNAYAVIGMSALSASVIGGPLTMTFIALETTGDLWLTTAVLVAVIIAAQVTREVFGYSFATWRFHLRGETIRSAADIGWMRDLTVEKMMRQDVQTVNAASTVAAFREQFPLSSTAYVVAVDEADRYIGLILVADAHAAESARQVRQGALAPSRRHAVAEHGGERSGARLRPRRVRGARRRRFLSRPPRCRHAHRSLRAAALFGGAGRPPPRSRRRGIADTSTSAGRLAQHSEYRIGGLCNRPESVR